MSSVFEVMMARFFDALTGLKLPWQSCVPLILLAISCRQSEQARPVPAPNSTVVARVGNATISAEAFQKELLRRFAHVSGDEITAAQKKSVLESLVRNETVYANATKAGFDHNPEVEASIKELVIARFKEKAFAPGEMATTDEELQTY